MPEYTESQVMRTIEHVYKMAYKTIAEERSKRPTPRDVRKMEADSIEVETVPDVLGTLAETDD